MIAKGILPESHSSSKKNRGCDFVARQLMEKTRVHEDSLIVMFVDLEKA